MANQNTLGVASVELVADLSKLDSSLRAALSGANTAGQQIGAKISDGIKGGLGSPEPVLSYFDNIKAHAALFKEAMGNLASSLERFKQPLNQLGGDLQSFGGKLSLGVTAPLVALGAASIKSSADIDSLFRGLTAVAGSAEGARRQFNELVEVAKLPGLGLEEAVQGSVRLQAFGFSSKEAKDSLLAFGNAIATVGGGRAELDRVIIQLGQMAGAGKVLTQDLRPIIQTVPQVAEILKKSFGADVLSEPAEKFAALGLSAKDVVKVLVTELGKLPKVTGGLKNDLENFSDSMKQSLAKLGDSIGPIVGPALGGLAAAAKSAVDMFTAMPYPIQVAGIALGGFAAAAGPVIYTIGGLARATSDLIGLAAKWAEWSRNATLAAEAARDVAIAGEAAQTAVKGAGAAADVSAVAFKGMGLALTTLGYAAVAAAAAFAGWKLAEWLDRNTESFHRFILEANDFVTGSNDFTDQEADMERFTKKLEQGLRDMGVEMHRLSGELLPEYAERLKKAADEAIKLNEAGRGAVTVFSNTAGSLNALSKAAGESITKQGELRAKYNEAKQAVEELANRQKYGADVTLALQLANKDLKSAYDALHPSIKAVSGSTADLLEKQTNLMAAHARAQQTIDELTAMQNAGKDVTIALRMANEDLTKSLADLAKEGQFIPSVFDAIAGRATDATMAMRSMFDMISGALPEVNALTKDMTSEMVKVGDGFVRVIRGNTEVVEQNGKSVVRVKDAHDSLAKSISSVGSAAPSAVSGMAAIGAQAEQTAAQIQAAATAMKNAADMANFGPSKGFGPSGGYSSAGGWGGSAGSGTLSPAETSGAPTPGTKAGDIKYISGAGGANMPMGGTAAFNSLELHLWTEEEIKAHEAFQAALAALTTAGLNSTSKEATKLQHQMAVTGATMEEVIAQWKALGEAQAAAKAAGEGLKKATDMGAQSVTDLQDQLWRLIDAGQGNTMAAWDLRGRIDALTGSYNTQANAASAAGSSMKQASMAIFDAAGVITTSVKNVAAGTSQARMAIMDAAKPKAANSSASAPSGPQARAATIDAPTPYYGPTNAAPVPYIPSGPYMPTMDNSAYQSGLGSVSIPIYANGSAAQAGQQVTQILRTQAGFV